MTILSGASRIALRVDALASHLAKGILAIPTSRGLITEGLGPQLDELAAGCNPARTHRPLWHVHCNPAFEHPNLCNTFWENFEAEFRLENARFTSAEHGKGNRGHHQHRVYDITAPDGRVADLRFDRLRRQKVAIVTAYALGLPMPPVPHTMTVARALRLEGRREIAQWVENHGHKPIVPALRTPVERQAEQRSGSDKAAVGEAVFEAWKVSDSPTAFRTALLDRRIRIALGDSQVVVVDHVGVAYSLGRLLGAVSKLGGDRIPAKAVKSRLAGLDLPTLPDLPPLPSLPVPPDPAVVARRLSRVATLHAEAQRALAELDWRPELKPPARVVRAMKVASTRSAKADAAGKAHDAAKARAVETAARQPKGRLGRLVALLRWQHTAAIERAHAAALAAEIHADQVRRTAALLASSAAIRSAEREAAWRADVAAERNAERVRLEERIATLAEAYRLIEQKPALALISGDALWEEVLRVRAERAAAIPPPAAPASRRSLTRGRVPTPR